MATEFELERAYDREDLAVLVDQLGVALEKNEPFRLHTPDAQLDIEFPARIVAEIEAEHEGDEQPTAELELELAWDDPDGSTIRVASTGETAADPADDDVPADKSDRSRSAEETEAIATEDEITAPEDDQGQGRTSRFEVYQDRAEEWRWRLVHWNGNIIADSGEGYTSKSNARRAVRGVMDAVPAATIEELES